MKQFLRNLIIVVLGVLVVDFIVGKVFGHLIETEPDAGTYASNEKQLIFDRSADIIIFGASTANHHYVSSMIEDSIGFSTYNAGVDGNNIFLSKCLLENFYTRCNPKLVILELKPLQVSSFEHQYITHKQFYYLNNTIKKYIDDRKNVYETIKLFSKMYCYNNSLLFVVGSHFMGKRENSLNGYKPLSGCDETLVPQTYDGPDLEIKKEYYQCLLDMNNLCKEHHTVFIISYSPSLIVNNCGIIRPLAEFCESNGIRFYNFDQIERFATPKLFRDKDHMNDEGAHIFTQMFIERLKADSIVEQFYQGE